MSSSYFIYKCIPPSGGEEPTYWNDTAGEWTADFTEATSFPKMILTTPLPVGTSSVLEIDNNGEVITTYLVTDLVNL